MKHLNQTDVTRNRITKWMLTAQPIDDNTVWVEKRQAINIGGSIHIINNGQVFQCAHCGHFDPEWSATEVINYFKETLDIEPYDIEIECRLASVARDK